MESHDHEVAICAIKIQSDNPARFHSHNMRAPCIEVRGVPALLDEDQHSTSVGFRVQVQNSMVFWELVDEASKIIVCSVDLDKNCHVGMCSDPVDQL